MLPRTNIENHLDSIGKFQASAIQQQMYQRILNLWDTKYQKGNIQWLEASLESFFQTCQTKDQRIKQKW